MHEDLRLSKRTLLTWMRWLSLTAKEHKEDRIRIGFGEDTDGLTSVEDIFLNMVKLCKEGEAFQVVKLAYELGIHLNQYSCLDKAFLLGCKIANKQKEKSRKATAPIRNAANSRKKKIQQFIAERKKNMPYCGEKAHKAAAMREFKVSIDTVNRALQAK